MPWRENCVDDHWMRWNLLLLVSREHLLLEETHIIKVLIYSPLKTNKRFLNSGTHLTERIVICDKLYAYHILSLVSCPAMNGALATQSSYLDVFNYTITCQRVHWLVTWCLPETDRVPFGCFEAIRLQAGLSVGASRWLGRRAYWLKTLNLFGVELLSASWSAATMLYALDPFSEFWNVAMLSSA